MIEHVQIGQKWLYQKSFSENDAKLFESAQYLNKKVYFISHNHEGENGCIWKVSTIWAHPLFTSMIMGGRV